MTETSDTFRSWPQFARKTSALPARQAVGGPFLAETDASQGSRRTGWSASDRPKAQASGLRKHSSPQPHASADSAWKRSQNHALTCHCEPIRLRSGQAKRSNLPPIGLRLLSLPSQGQTCYAPRNNVHRFEMISQYCPGVGGVHERGCAYPDSLWFLPTGRFETPFSRQNAAIRPKNTYFYVLTSLAAGV